MSLLHPVLWEKHVGIALAFGKAISLDPYMSFLFLYVLQYFTPR